VVKRKVGHYQLFYSIRRRSTGRYCLGYAESADGITWKRKDEEIGIDISDSPFENEAVMYSAVVEANGRTFCFYNGNAFGRDGFAVAELLD
jgi:hypothetical protein